MNLRIGVCSWSFADVLRGNRSVEEVARKAYEAGFHSLEAAYIRRSPLSITQNPPDSRAVPITSLATLELHRFHLTDPSAARRRNGLDTVSEMIRCAEQAHIASISFSPGRLWPDQEMGQALDDLVDDLAPLVERGKQKGVMIALENLPGQVLVTRAAMRSVLDRLPDARLCLDIGNTLLDPPIGDWVDLFSGDICKLHISDGVARDGMFQARVPGQGDIDWQSVVDALMKIDRDIDAFVEMPLAGGQDETQLLLRLSSSIQSLFGPQR